jgi:hypothetical protein
VNYIVARPGKRHESFRIPLLYFGHRFMHHQTIR